MNLIPNSSTDIIVDDTHTQGLKYAKPYTGLIKGQPYTFSADIKKLVGNPNTIQVTAYKFGANVESHTVMTTPDANGHIVANIQPYHDGTDLIIYAGIAGNTHDNKIIIHHPKLELWNVATPWSLANEDILALDTRIKALESK